MRTLATPTLALLLLLGCPSAPTGLEPTPTPTPGPTSACAERLGAPAASIGPGETLITHVPTDVGAIAVRVRAPQVPRYADEAPLVVNVATFFTTTAPFYTDLEATRAGFFHVSYVWPGAEDPQTGACSDGVTDHGGPDDIAALAQVVRFATAGLPDIHGRTLDSWLDGVALDADNAGLWAFSHPGIAAINTLTRHPDTQEGVAWFVGRENPTQDQHAAVEMGHFAADGSRVLNPAYRFPEDYHPVELSVDYSRVRWAHDHIEPGHEDEPGRAWFDTDDDGEVDPGEHMLSFRVPTMWGTRYLSRPLLRALAANGLEDEGWPADLATVEEAEEAWAYRTVADRYDALADSDIAALLVFAERQHVQPLPDAVSVHSAWDGLTGAGLWVRLNPDRAYLDWVSGATFELPEEWPANQEPADWATIGADLGHPRATHPTLDPGELAGLAGIAELADRTRMGRWEDDLDAVLVEAEPPR